MSAIEYCASNALRHTPSRWMITIISTTIDRDIKRIERAKELYKPDRQYLHVIELI